MDNLCISVDRRGRVLSMYLSDKDLQSLLVSQPLGYITGQEDIQYPQEEDPGGGNIVEDIPDRDRPRDPLDESHSGDRRPHPY